jgi:hypothetical protein
VRRIKIRIAYFLFRVFCGLAALCLRVSRRAGTRWELDERFARLAILCAKAYRALARYEYKLTFGECDW